MVEYRITCWSIMFIMHDLSRAKSWLKLRVIPWLDRKSDFSDSMHDDRSAIFDQPPSTERANKPWIGFLPALHYPSIYWWHYVMVSIIQPWTWDRGLLWLTLSFFIYITAKPVGYIYPKEISINTVKFLYQTIAHLDSSMCVYIQLYCMRKANLDSSMTSIRLIHI